MKFVSAPKNGTLYADRDLDCQQAIEASFQELVERALAAGWRPLEVSEAIGQLALADRYYRNSKALVDAYNMLDDIVAAHKVP